MNKINFKTSTRIVISFYLLLLNVSLNEISAYRNLQMDNSHNKDYIYMMFSVIITISLLSLTVLSIILDNSHKVLGIPFNEYSKYSTFPVKFRTFFINTMIVNVTSVLIIFLNLPVTLTIVFIALLIWLSYYTLEYFKYLTDNECVAIFLTSEATLLKYGNEIELAIAQVLVNMDELASRQADYLLSNYKKIKKIREKLRVGDEYERAQ